MSERVIYEEASTAPACRYRIDIYLHRLGAWSKGWDEAHTLWIAKRRAKRLHRCGNTVRIVDTEPDDEH